jgi:hypothetical protein
MLVATASAPMVAVRSISHLAYNRSIDQASNMDEDSGYRGGSTTGGRWGCALSIVIGLPLIGFAFAVLSLGDCAPGVQCTSGWTLMVLAIIIAAVVGFGSRAAINALAARRKRGR